MKRNFILFTIAFLIVFAIELLLPKTLNLWLEIVILIVSLFFFCCLVPLLLKKKKG